MHKHKKNRKNTNPLHLELREIEPATKNQEEVFDSFADKNLVIMGSAGTGKSFISIFLALEEILEYKEYKKLIIIRSAVPSRDIGFLKGTEKEKVAVYEQPYQNICQELFQRGDAYEVLTQKHIIEFMSTSYLRGLTFDNAIILVDEIQNATFKELSAIITRTGKNSKIIFCGDIKQSDLKEYDIRGVKRFIEIIKLMKSFSIVTFTVDDVIRGGLVKEFLLAEDEYESIELSKT